MEVSQIAIERYTPTHQADIQNNNVETNESDLPLTMNRLSTDTRLHQKDNDTNSTTMLDNFSCTDGHNIMDDNSLTSNINTSQMTTAFKIGSCVTPVNMLNNQVNGPMSGCFDSAPSSLTNMDEYIEDPLPVPTFGDMIYPESYEDPSMGYIFVNNQWNSTLDNSEALLKHLQTLGVRVNPDYLNLDFDLDLSRSTSVSTESDTGSSEDEQKFIALMESQIPCHVAYNTVFQSQPNSIVETGESDGNVFLFDSEANIFYDHAIEDEVAEAEILPNGDVVVTYDNFKKHYRPRLNMHENYINYLEIVHKNDDQVSCDTSSTQETKAVVKQSLPKHILRKILARKFAIDPLPLKKLANLPSKYAQRFRKFIAEEVTYDAVTPDSGVHENFAALSAEDQEKQRNEWQSELAKTEDEIQTLRQVLAARVKHAQDLKRRLGVTVWREFSDDISTSFKNVKESQTVQKANEVITGFGEAVVSAPLYQKTAGAVSAVGEKTTSLFGGIGAKFGQLKETPTFKSFEERIGSTVTAAKSKMGGSGSNSTQDFQEAIQESEGENIAANGEAPLDQTQLDPNMQQPTS